MTACVLIFVGWGHFYVNGIGSVFYKRCTYQCDAKKVSQMIGPHDACQRSVKI